MNGRPPVFRLKESESVGRPRERTLSMDMQIAPTLIHKKKILAKKRLSVSELQWLSPNVSRNYDEGCTPICRRCVSISRDFSVMDLQTSILKCQRWLQSALPNAHSTWK